MNHFCYLNELSEWMTQIPQKQKQCIYMHYLCIQLQRIHARKLEHPSASLPLTYLFRTHLILYFSITPCLYITETYLKTIVSINSWANVLKA